MLSHLIQSCNRRLGESTAPLNVPVLRHGTLTPRHRVEVILVLDSTVVIKVKLLVVQLSALLC